ncbi:MAG TPA: hypothetical protein VMU89_12735 [Thermomicrobiaceae bacterium]|nr:hypothetical protein [Thermomicrobiaceae bacterium]
MPEESGQPSRARRAVSTTVGDEAPSPPVRRPQKPVNRRRRRLALALGSVAAVVFMVVVGWLALNRSNDPNYQQQITMPSMAGVQPYLVNVWAAPNPPTVGQVTLDVQVTSNVGSSEPLNSVSLDLSRPDGSSAGTVKAAPLPAGSGPKDGFSAGVNFDRPGNWKIVVSTDAGVLRQSTFVINVQG